MGMFRGVRYIRLSTVALKIMQTLPADDKESIINTMFAAFQQLEQGQEVGIDTDNTLVGIALNEAIPEMVEGYKQYMRNATQNKKDTVSTVSEQCSNSVPTVSEPTEQTRPEQIKNRSNTDQTRTKLMAEGFTEVEVDRALSEVKPDADVKNLSAYVKSIILRQRQQKPTAHNYEQRDYTEKEKMLRQRMIDLASEVS